MNYIKTGLEHFFKTNEKGYIEDFNQNSSISSENPLLFYIKRIKPQDNKVLSYLFKKTCLDNALFFQDINGYNIFEHLYNEKNFLLEKELKSYYENLEQKELKIFLKNVSSLGNLEKYSIHKLLLKDHWSILNSYSVNKDSNYLKKHNDLNNNIELELAKYIYQIIAEEEIATFLLMQENKSEYNSVYPSVKFLANIQNIYDIYEETKDKQLQEIIKKNPWVFFAVKEDIFEQEEFKNLKYKSFEDFKKIPLINKNFFKKEQLDFFENRFIEQLTNEESKAHIHGEMQLNLVSLSNEDFLNIILNNKENFFYMSVFLDLFFVKLKNHEFDDIEKADKKLKNKLIDLVNYGLTHSPHSLNINLKEVYRNYKYYQEEKKNKKETFVSISDLDFAYWNSFVPKSVKRKIFIFESFLQIIPNKKYKDRQSKEEFFNNIKNLEIKNPKNNKNIENIIENKNQDLLKTYEKEIEEIINNYQSVNNQEELKNFNKKIASMIEIYEQTNLAEIKENTKELLQTFIDFSKQNSQEFVEQEKERLKTKLKITAKIG